MAAKKKTTKKKATKRKTTAKKKAPARKAAKKTSSRKTAAKKTSAKKAPAKKAAGFSTSKKLSPKASRAVKAAAESLWNQGTAPHTLLQELHEVLLLRCLDEADGNYAGAAALFGPSRQSVQQYANSALRDNRWKQYQQNRRKKRGA